MPNFLLKSLKIRFFGSPKIAKISRFKHVTEEYQFFNKNREKLHWLKIAKKESQKIG